MQKSLIAVIADRYRQQDFDALSLRIYEGYALIWE